MYRHGHGSKYNNKTMPPTYLIQSGLVNYGVEETAALDENDNDDHYDGFISFGTNRGGEEIRHIHNFQAFDITAVEEERAARRKAKVF